MGMNHPFSFTTPLNTLPSFLSRNDLDLETWFEMVLQFNSRSQIMMRRIEAEKVLKTRNAVLWVSLGGLVVLVVVGMFGLSVRIVMGFWGWVRLSSERCLEDELRGRDESVVGSEKPQGKRNKGILGNMDKSFGNADGEKDTKDLLLNNNNATINKSPESEETNNELHALKQETHMSRLEIKRLTQALHQSDLEIRTFAPLLAETAHLKSQLALLSKGASHQEQTREILETRLSSLVSEISTLKTTLSLRDTEMQKLGPLQSEIKELRFNLESARAQLSARGEEVEKLVVVKGGLEAELERMCQEVEGLRRKGEEEGCVVERLRRENKELLKRVVGLVGKHKEGIVQIREVHEKELRELRVDCEKELREQRVGYDKDIKELKEEFEDKMKEMREGVEKCKEGVVSEGIMEGEGNDSRETSTKLHKSAKRHSRSSLPRSISGSFKNLEPKDMRGGR